MSTLKDQHNSKDGYFVAALPYPSKRICLTLDLKDDTELIAEYKKYHSPENYWKEIGEGIKKSGVPVMDIYLVDNRMFMICEVPIEQDFDEAWNIMGTFERQGEWGKLMSQFQQAIPGHKMEWVKMEKVYEIPA